MNENIVKKDNLLVLSQLFYFILITCYIFGFIIVNSHLVKNGIYSFEIFNTIYLAAGAIFIIVVAIFGFTVGRRVYFLDNDFYQLVSNYNKLHNLKKWSIFCLLYILVELLFAVIFGVFWTAYLLFDDVQEIKILIVLLTVFFVIEYLIAKKINFYRNHIYIGISVIIITSFFIVFAIKFLLSDKRILSLFFYYMGNLMVLNIVIQISQKRKDNNIFKYFWGLIFLFSTATLFGNNYYDEIKREYGGGKPMFAKLIVSNYFPAYLSKMLKTENGVIKDAKILAETNSDILIQTKSEEEQITIRISKNLIQAIIPTKCVNRVEKTNLKKKLGIIN